MICIENYIGMLLVKNSKNVSKKKKYREVQEWNGIRVGRASSFHVTKKYETDCEVLKIFPDGNDNTCASEPYYVKMDYGSLTYFGREHFENSNLSPIPIPDPPKFKLHSR